jgi:hypothetical protein
VPSVPGYVAGPSTQEQNSTPEELDLAISFLPFLSTVSFEATGLAPNGSWTLVLANRTLTSNSAEVNVSLANGSYSYSFPNVAGYYAVPGGTLAVTGHPVVVSVRFVPFDFAVVFLEFGLPNGTPWKLTFQGTVYTQATRALEFSAPNGSYSFAVAPVPGYTLESGGGPLEVEGRDVVVQVAFTPVPVVPPAPPTPSSPLPLEYALLAAVGLALVVGLLLGRRGRSPEPAPGAPPPPTTEPPLERLDSYDEPPP